LACKDVSKWRLQRHAASLKSMDFYLCDTASKYFLFRVGLLTN
jgi:hypothetical protein